MFLRQLTAIICLALVLLSNSVVAQTRPNILLIMAEDMSARVGAFGDNVAVTPNLDRLARISVRYPNTFTTAGVCAPSRAAHILGVHQMTVGAQHMRTRSFRESAYRTVPPAHIKAYPELLRRKGYYTFTSSKLDYQFSDTSAGSGPFTIWDDEGRRSTWKGRANGQPFFGFITIKESHEGQIFPTTAAKNNARGNRSQIVRPDQVSIPPYYPDHPAIRKDIAQHYNNIYRMDEKVGKLLNQLDKDGLTDSTIVIWTTDHGDGLPRGKREIYDSGIKVPLIVHWPERLKPVSVDNNTVDQKLVSFLDIGPSVLTMAGLAVPEYMHGSPQLVPDASAKRDYIYAAKDRMDEFNFRERAVRDSQFKYINNQLPGVPGGQHIAYRDQMLSMQTLWKLFALDELNSTQRLWFLPRPTEELYDIVADPHEVNNLAKSRVYADRLAQMKSALAKWRDAIVDYSDTSELTMAKAFWPNGEQPITQAPQILIDQSGTVRLVPAEVDDSMGYRINDAAWSVYNGPIVIAKNSRIDAKSVRYGWAESPLVTVSRPAAN